MWSGQDERRVAKSTPGRTSLHQRGGPGPRYIEHTTRPDQEDHGVSGPLTPGSISIRLYAGHPGRGRHPGRSARTSSQGGRGRVRRRHGERASRRLPGKPAQPAAGVRLGARRVPPGMGGAGAAPLTTETGGAGGRRDGVVGGALSRPRRAGPGAGIPGAGLRDRRKRARRHAGPALRCRSRSGGRGPGRAGRAPARRRSGPERPGARCHSGGFGRHEQDRGSPGGPPRSRPLDRRLVRAGTSSPARRLVPRGGRIRPARPYPVGLVR